MYTFKKGIYAGVLKGDIPDKVITTTPTLKWVGHKLPFSTWRQIISFCANHSDREVLITLLYSSEKGMRVFIPQQYASSASINSESDKELFPLLTDYIVLGSLHTHPKFEAFSSETDDKDEKNNTGIHITLGQIDQKICTYHIRTLITGYKYDQLPNLIDIVELPDLKFFPKGMEELLLCHTLKDGYPHPEEWETKLLQKPSLQNFSHHSGIFNNNFPVKDESDLLDLYKDYEDIPIKKHKSKRKYK